MSASIVSADDEYKPYLHKAVVPEHQKVKLYGTYSTDVFPGSADYSYQIDVPPGTNGLQPSLTVSYSSQNLKQRPGILGAGWSISTTYIFRDINGTVDDTSDDQFKLFLNGAVYNLVYNQSDNFYHSDIESYMRMENLSISNDTFGMYWQVTTKDGTKYVLGDSQSTELISNTGKNYAIRWTLSKIEDTYGNTISYFYSENPYSEDSGTLYLNKIMYNNEQSRVVYFAYEPSVRPDRRRVYEQGNVLEESHRLIGINISVNGVRVRGYVFSYADLNPEKTLTSVAKISFTGSDGSELYNTQFSYYNATSGFTKANNSWAIPMLFQSIGADDMGVRLVDVNNDGLVDIVRSDYRVGVNEVWINNGSGWVNQSSTWALPVWIVDGNTTNADVGVKFADLNNDGLVDIIESTDLGTNVAYLNTGSGWVDASSVWKSPIPFVLKTGSVWADAGVRFTDLNGDGYPDMIRAGTGVKAVYLNNRSGWVQTSNWTSPDYFVTGTYGSDNGLRLLDLNGDGLEDLLISNNIGGVTTVNSWLNTGSGWAAPSQNWVPQFNFTDSTITDTGVRFADVNGDGLIDMLGGVSSAGLTKNIWLNNGTGWVLSSWTIPERFVEADRNVGRRLADVNGDGLPDEVESLQNSSETAKYVWLKDSTIPYAIKFIKTELGGNITISYQNSTYYNNTNASGVGQLGYNVLVVSSVIQNNSINGSLNVAACYNYSYSGGMFDSKTREFRGFATNIETLPDGSVVKHYFIQSYALKGKEWRTEAYDSQGNIYSAQENSYNYTQSGSQYSTFLTSAATYTYDGQLLNPRITNTTFVYDQYGNVLTTSSLGDVSVTGDEKTEVFDYVYNTSAWILDKPSRHRLYAADGTLLRDVKYSYDGGVYGSAPSKGDITAEEDWLSGQNVRKEFSYDSYGNVVAEKDALGRVMVYNYGVHDNTSTFADSVTNALGQRTDYGYDLGTGNLLWQEKNGIRTSYEYDVFGRILKEIQPYDSSFMPTKSYTYSFDGTAPESIKVSQRTTANNSLDAYYFYDGLGNLVQLKTPSYDGKQVVKNFFYDGQNRVRAVQNAYFDSFSVNISIPSSSEKFTNYTYDALSRVVNVTNPDYTNATVVFNRWNISTFDENNHRKDYITDAYDRIVAVKEYNIDPILNDGVVSVYTTSYGYDGADSLLWINDTYGNQFKFTYDSLGRRTRLNDPDIGEVNYTYDLANNFISQRGGSGNLVSGDGFYREYNALNQLTKVRNGSSSTSPLLEQYYYDHTGERIKIWRNDSAKTVVYTPFREFMQIRNSTGIYNYTYIYDGSTLVARVNPDNSKYFYHPDELGSTTLITNSSGGIVENSFYEPYGSVTSGGTSESKLYTGQFADTATGQDYYGARYYKPTIGKFIQFDDIIRNVYNPQNLNRYSYVLNNPYKYTDPTGKTIFGFQLSGEAALGGGAATSTGFFVDIEKYSIKLYGFTSKSDGPGIGIGLGGSIDFIFGPFTSAEDVKGKSLTATAGTGFGRIGAGISIPKINDYYLQSYVTVGVGLSTPPIQGFGGPMSTTIHSVGSANSKSSSKILTVAVKNTNGESTTIKMTEGFYKKYQAALKSEMK